MSHLQLGSTIKLNFMMEMKCLTTISFLKPQVLKMSVTSPPALKEETRSFLLPELPISYT